MNHICSSTAYTHSRHNPAYKHVLHKLQKLYAVPLLSGGSYRRKAINMVMNVRWQGFKLYEFSPQGL